MKKRLALLLAVVMTLSLLPMNVFAASTNRVDKTVTVIKDQVLTRADAPKLTIKPNDGFSTEVSIRLELENAEWIANDKYVGSQSGASWDDYARERELTPTQVQQYGSNSGITNAVNFDNEFPWTYTISTGNPKVAILTLAPVTTYMLQDSGRGKDGLFAIPMNIKALEEGDIKVTVNASGTVISSGTYTFATGTSSKGATVTTVSEVVTQRDNVTIKPLSIRETIRGTVKGGGQVRLQLTGNFEFAPQSVYISSDYNLAHTIQSVSNLVINGDTMTFNIPSFTPTTNSLDTYYIAGSSDMLNGIVIRPLDEDEDYGDINLTIRGDDVTRETIKVGERRDYGFTFKGLEEAPTILAGRLSGWYNNQDQKQLNNGVDDDEVETAQIFFAETIANTWITQRRLSFTVPEGIKIAKYEFEDETHVNLGSTGVEVTLTKDGRTLHIANPDITSTKDCAEFKLRLWLSAELGYEGDVALSVAGGGVPDGTLSDVVIAKVKAPITIESATTSMNLGYQNLNSADIVIKETEVGALIKGETVSVAIDSIYGQANLGFADEGITYEVGGGEITLTNFKVSSGAITFKIDRVSKTAPGSITLKNVKIGSNRAVSYGGYDLKVVGSAFATNYYENVDGHTSTVRDYIPEFDDNEGYKFKEYIKIVTETGTLDKVVKVTIGEKTALIDNEAVDIDVAAYIQTASNSTMVPLRFVSLALGVDNVANMDTSSRIQWDPNTKTVTIFYAAGTATTPIQFTAGSDLMLVNGTPVPMVSPSGQRVKAEITDSRMFVPFRALGDALGVNVTWDADTRTAIYNAK